SFSTATFDTSAVSTILIIWAFSSSSKSHEVVALMEPNFRHPSTTPSPSLSIPIDAYGSRFSKLNLLVMVATVSPPSLQTLIVHQLPDHFPAHRLRIGAASVDVERVVDRLSGAAGNGNTPPRRRSDFRENRTGQQASLIHDLGQRLPHSDGHSFTNIPANLHHHPRW